MKNSSVTVTLPKEAANTIAEALEKAAKQASRECGCSGVCTGHLAEPAPIAKLSDLVRDLELALLKIRVYVTESLERMG